MWNEWKILLNAAQIGRSLRLRNLFHEFYFWCNEHNTNSTRERKRSTTWRKKWAINEFIHSRWAIIQFKDGNNNIRNRNCRFKSLRVCPFIFCINIIITVIQCENVTIIRLAYIKCARTRAHNFFYVLLFLVFLLFLSLVAVSLYRFPLIYIFDEFHIKTDGKGINLEVWICRRPCLRLFFCCIFHEQSIYTISYIIWSAYFILHLNIVALFLAGFWYAYWWYRLNGTGARRAVHRKTW